MSEQNRPGPLSPEANAKLLAYFGQLTAEQRASTSAAGADLHGNPLVHRTVTMPNGGTAGIACTLEKSAELSDADIIAMVQKRWPDDCN